ncbi:hypothetical protein C0Q70_19406 [Pomacea canaliculata]|uniref:Uncharacterized protein n=1 Tax=Pomacea canaliculata TaxID=400727 RepID=A0A2T7NJ92_POMCA|nr:hypothetical protein C0Q70_19406 [Pomacea canaliculata]
MPDPLLAGSDKQRTLGPRKAKIKDVGILLEITRLESGDIVLRQENKYSPYVKKFAVEYTCIHARTVAFEQTGPDIKATQNCTERKETFRYGWQLQV